MRGEARRQKRGQALETGSHPLSPDQSGLYNLKEKELFLSLFFVPARVFSAFGLVQVFSPILVQAPLPARDRQEGGGCWNPFVLAAAAFTLSTAESLALWNWPRCGLLSGATWTCEPYGAAFDGPPHVLAPDQRNVFAKFLLIEVLQPLAVAGLLPCASPQKPLPESGKLLAEFLSRSRRRCARPLPPAKWPGRGAPFPDS